MTTVNNPRRRVVTAMLAGSLAVSVTACGDDSSDGTPLDSVPVPTSTVPTTAPTTLRSTIDHPVGADDVVLRIGYRGGFVPAEYAFLDLPTLLVTGDGRLIVQGPQIEIYPGPLLPNLQVRTVSEEGIQQLLDMAAQHGLLTQREYVNPTNIADAPDTVVEISANGETYTHAAYALGLGDVDGETDELRQALAGFVDEATGDWLTGDNPELGPEQAYTSDTFYVRTSPLSELSGYEVEPTIVDWPAGAPALADDADEECVSVPAAVIGDAFTTANQLTFFREDGIVYMVTPKPALPGDRCAS